MNYILGFNLLKLGVLKMIYLIILCKLLNNIGLACTITFHFSIKFLKLCTSSWYQNTERIILDHVLKPFRTKKKKLEEEFLVKLQVYFLQNNIRVFSWLLPCMEGLWPLALMSPSFITPGGFCCP